MRGMQSLRRQRWFGRAALAGWLVLGSCQDDPPPTAAQVIEASSAVTVHTATAAGSVAPGSGIVRSDEDCRRSRACREFGACAERAGRCYAKTDADCARSMFCKQAGQCKVHKDRCVIAAASDDDCRRDHGANGRNPCKLSGYCTARDGVCLAGSDEDCRQSMACSQSATCTAKDGECVLASAKDCEQSVLCKHGQLCLFKLVEGQGVCYSDKDEDDEHGDHQGHEH
jgi:hypothetical protein